MSALVELVFSQSGLVLKTEQNEDDWRCLKNALFHQMYVTSICEGDDLENSSFEHFILLLHDT